MYIIFILNNNIFKKRSFLAKSPSQQQSAPYQPTGEYQNDEPQQSRPYRGGGQRKLFFFI